MSNKHIAYCGVDCSVCPDYLSGKCPDCRRTEWPQDDRCAPVACCKAKGIAFCGQCEDFPCYMMREFYEESESHERAFELMKCVKELRLVDLRQAPELMDAAADWFHGKWGVPREAYIECMQAYLAGDTEYGWYLCMEGERIVGGLGVIENDFHDRPDLTPNICAVYTEEDRRGIGIAGRLLQLAVEELRAKGVSPVYLVTDHIGFYERYGWEFLCLVHGADEPGESRMYVHY